MATLKMNTQVKAPKATLIESEKVDGEEGPTTFQQLLIGEELGFTQAPANVGVSVTSTVGLPNYSNIKVSVSLNLPCTPDSIANAEAFAWEWCEAQMKKRIKELLEESNG